MKGSVLVAGLVTVLGFLVFMFRQMLEHGVFARVDEAALSIFLMVGIAFLTGLVAGLEIATFTFRSIVSRESTESESNDRRL